MLARLPGIILCILSQKARRERKNSLTGESFLIASHPWERVSSLGKHIRTLCDALLFKETHQEVFGFRSPGQSGDRNQQQQGGAGDGEKPSRVSPRGPAPSPSPSWPQVIPGSPAMRLVESEKHLSPCSHLGEDRPGRPWCGASPKGVPEDRSVVT